jgi:hypothetical protein
MEEIVHQRLAVSHLVHVVDQTALRQRLSRHLAVFRVVVGEQDDDGAGTSLLRTKN